jgi:outer membrane protein OmpA-like peptidoglycan-associated protein
MYQWRPSQWVKWAPLTILPFVAGSWLQTGGLVDDVVARAQAAAGDSVKVGIDGRDVTLSGQVTGQDSLDAAVKAVWHTYGVRTVDFGGVKIVEPVALAAPTIDSITTNMTMPEIKGTWPQDVAKTLSVAVNGKTYELGKDAELQSAAGAWTLKPAAAIADGAYDVTASVSDGGKMVTGSVAPGKLVIDTVAPALPVIGAVAAGAAWPYPITGTWPEADAKGLSVKLADKTYVLGTDAAIKSDGKGNFTFDPRVDLKPGSYDVNFTVEDLAGNKTELASPAAIVIAEGAKPAEPAAKTVEADTTPPEAATVNPAPADAVWPYAITGTWPEGDATALSLSLAGQAYALGKDKELVSDGKGKFTFMPSTNLAPGSYDIDMITIDAKDNFNQSVARAAIVIPEPKVMPVPVALTAPTVETQTSDKDVPVVKGTWGAGVAKSLSVTLDSTTYVLGKDFALLSNAAGNWTLKPAKALANGTYDVAVEVGDGAGATMKDATANELVVNVSPPPPPPLERPTVETSASDNDHLMVMGTWPSKTAKTLTVALDGTSYVLGTDAELTADGDHWMLMSKNGLANGTYNVVAHVSDDSGQRARDATQGELTVNVAAAPAPEPAPAPAAAPLPAPTVESSTTDSDHPTVKGSWAAGVAKSLTVGLDGTNYVLGKDFDLLSDAAGNWKLKPSKPMVNGTYDVIAKVTDGADQSATDVTKDELVINVAPPPPAPSPEKPYDCLNTLARISAVFPVRFDFDKDVLTGAAQGAVNQYAALLKDPRCVAVKLTAGGHADYKGSEKYNQGLSERRAKTVIDALVAGGITADRLTGIGYSKDKPLDPALDDSARAKNRRVEFTAQ